ncbi:MAG: hypothetical protein U5Q16_16885 [Gammaproteobacteria bacterium]|nr:hypothetical protein [Gammaproteobacteria bacterium]
MQVVTRTDEYTIYKKRNQRYAVRNKDKQWVRGDDKVAILLSQGLIQAPAPKAPEEPEPAEEAAEAPAAEAAEADDKGAESEAEESDADKS